MQLACWNTDCMLIARGSVRVREAEPDDPRGDGNCVDAGHTSRVEGRWMDAGCVRREDHTITVSSEGRAMLCDGLSTGSSPGRALHHGALRQRSHAEIHRARLQRQVPLQRGDLTRSGTSRMRSDTIRCESGAVRIGDTREDAAKCDAARATTVLRSAECRMTRSTPRQRAVHSGSGSAHSGSARPETGHERLRVALPKRPVQ